MNPTPHSAFDGTNTGPARMGPTPPLTSIRFFAAFWVVLYHTMHRFDSMESTWITVNKFVDIGYSAVGLFFVLSGFIMYNVYPVLNTHALKWRFFVARVARIYPLYALTLLADAPRLFAWRVVKYGLTKGFFGTAATFFASLFGPQVWFPSLGGLNFPSWSVATELAFYLAFPLLLPWISSIRTKTTAVGWAFICWSLFSFMPALFLSGLVDESGSLSILVERNPLFRVPEFALGAIIGRLFSILDVPSKRRVHISIMSCLAGVSGLTLIVLTHDPLRARMLENALTVPVYALLIFASATSAGMVARILSSQILVAFGAASYALYLIHALFWDYAGNIGDGESASNYPIYIFSVLLGSLAIHYAIENPARVKILATVRARSSNNKPSGAHGF